MQPSVFKACYSAFYWPWVIYPMGKHALILKGGANHSAIPVVFISTLYHDVQYFYVIMKSYYLGYVHKHTTLQ